MDND
jgi:hypothetical protein